jgi:hypothetical protein
MKDIKNIDRLFQEKFRDFEQLPPPNLWRKIEKSLTGKSKNNKPVLWLWLGGIAAGLTLFLFINNPFYKPVNTLIDKTIKKENTKSVKSTQTDITTTDTEELKLNQINTKNYREKSTLPKNNISKQSINNVSSVEHNKIKAETNKSHNKIINLEKDKIINTSKKDNPNTSIDYLAGIQDKKNELIKKVDNKKLDDNAHKVIKTNITIKDSIKNSNNHLKLLAANTPNERSKKQKNYIKKWTISTMAAPIFFNSFNTEASSIDAKFNKNTKKGEFSTAYGVQLAYQIDDRLSIQTGFHKVDYGYKTDEVYVSLNNFTDSKSDIDFNSIINIRDFRPPPNQFGVKTDIASGSLMQILGYYEVPLEVKYKIIKGNISANILGGFSTLIRNKDEIYYQIDNLSEKTNKKSGLNPINISGNFGMEIDYQINKKIFLNITPLIKIHTNTFNNDTNGFSPYAIGVYSGLNYRF